MFSFLCNQWPLLNMRCYIISCVCLKAGEVNRRALLIRAGFLAHRVVGRSLTHTFPSHALLVLPWGEIEGDTLHRPGAPYPLWQQAFFSFGTVRLVELGSSSTCLPLSFVPLRPHWEFWCSPDRASAGASCHLASSACWYTGSQWDPLEELGFNVSVSSDWLQLYLRQRGYKS